MMRAAILAVAWSVLAGPVTAQVFQPPEGGGSSSSGAPGAGVTFGLYGFSTRAGGQINRGGQIVVGSTVDVATLGTPQLRVRPSFEIGFGQNDQSLHAALEVVYRFLRDDAPSVPYFGVGVGYYDAGGSASAKVWPNLVMGFELPFRPTFNWLFEYHALDRIDQHRFLIGLATRGAAQP